MGSYLQDPRTQLRRGGRRSLACALRSPRIPPAPAKPARLLEAGEVALSPVTRRPIPTVMPLSEWPSCRRVGRLEIVKGRWFLPGGVHETCPVAPPDTPGGSVGQDGTIDCSRSGGGCSLRPWLLADPERSAGASIFLHSHRIAIGRGGVAGVGMGESLDVECQVGDLLVRERDVLCGLDVFSNAFRCGHGAGVAVGHLPVEEVISTREQLS